MKKRSTSGLGDVTSESSRRRHGILLGSGVKKRVPVAFRVLVPHLNIERYSGLSISGNSYV